MMTYLAGILLVLSMILYVLVNMFLLMAFAFVMVVDPILCMVSYKWREEELRVIEGDGESTEKKNTLRRVK